MKNLYAIAGAVVIISAVGIAGYFLLQKQKPKVSITSPKIVVTETTAQAFGTLSESFVAATDPNTKDAARSTDLATGTTMPVESPMPLPPDAVMYRYVYSGDQLQLSEATLEVLERRIGSAAAASSELLQAAGYNSVDLSTFGPLDVQNLTLGRDDGYVITMNGLDGSVSIYKNSGVNDMLVKSNSAAQQQSTPLSEKEVVSTANAFLSQHGIDTSLYGTPKVATSNPTVSAARPDTAVTYPNGVTYFGGQQTVIYPLQVNSLSVYGLWGEDVGLSVIVDSVTKIVMSVYGLTTHEYLRSAYPAVTDSSAILAVAERGGLYSSPIAAGAKVVEAKLGTPDRVLAQMFRYDSGKNHDLLVPALRFQVLNPQPGMVSTIVVPLIKDLLNVDQPVIKPMAIDGSSGSTGSGSSGSGVIPAPSE